MMIFLNPFNGLVLITAMLPQALLQAVTGKLLGLFSMATPIKAIGGLTFIATLIKLATNKKPLRFQKDLIIIFSVLFFICIFISGLTQIGAFTRGNFTVFASMLIFAVIIIALVDTLRRFRIVIWTGAIAIFFGSLGAVLGFVAYGDSNRMSGAYYGPNEFAILLLPFIGISLYLVFTSKAKAAKIAALVITMTLILALISTVSRGGIIGLGGMFIVAAMKAKKKMRAIFIIGVLAVIFLNFMPAAMRDRFQKTRVEETYTGEGTVDSTTRRYNLSAAAWAMFREKPLFGVGIGNYFYNCSQYAPVSPGRAHNMYLEVLAELGIVGGFLFFGILFLTFGKLNRLRRSNSAIISGYASGMFIGLIGFCFAAIFLHAEQEKVLWFIIFMSVALKRISDNEGKAKNA